MNRIDQTLARLKAEGRSGLATYFTAGDPDFETSLKLLRGLGKAGADLIELGLPFSDPVADGPTIQAAHIRARQAGQTAARTLELVAALRETDAATPLVLMGYLNPVMQYGIERFINEAAEAGVDGLLLVDLPIEHAAPFEAAAETVGLHLIRMTAPTSDDARLARILDGARGFVYHVTLTGTTGAASASAEKVGEALERLRRQGQAPVAAGFGIRTPEQVRALAGTAELIVVGSRLVEVLAAQGAEVALEEVGRLGAALK